MEDNKHNQIFFDPRNRRWPRIKGGFFILLFSLFILVIAFIVSIYLAPGINELPLAAVNHLKTINYHPIDKNKSKRKPAYLERTIKHNQHKNRLGFINQGTAHPLIMGFLVTDDDASFRSLVRNLYDIDMVIGDFLQLASADGDIKELDSDKQANARNYILKHRPQIKVIPKISNLKDNNWQPKMIAELLDSTAKQNRLIQTLLDYVNQHQFSGINLDFQELPTHNQKIFTEFLKRLTKIFHQHELIVSINLSGDNKTYNVKEIANIVDFIVLIAYNQHREDMGAGPIASMEWFEHSLALFGHLIPSSKLVIGLGNYGYDWEKQQKAGVESNFQDLMINSDLANAQIQFNPVSLNPTFAYLEDDSIAHNVWFLDAVTLFNQLAKSQSLQPYGYAVWRLGSEKINNMEVIQTRGYSRRTEKTWKH